MWPLCLSLIAAIVFWAVITCFGLERTVRQKATEGSCHKVVCDPRPTSSTSGCAGPTPGSSTPTRWWRGSRMIPVQRRGPMAELRRRATFGALIWAGSLLLVACATTSQPTTPEQNRRIRAAAEACLPEYPAVVRYEVDRFGQVIAYFREDQRAAVTDPFFGCIRAQLRTRSPLATPASRSTPGATRPTALTLQLPPTCGSFGPGARCPRSGRPSPDGGKGAGMSRSRTRQSWWLRSLRRPRPSSWLPAGGRQRQDPSGSVIARGS